MRLTSYTISSMTGITPVGERRQVTLAPVERAASSSRLRCDSKSRVTQTSDSPRRSDVQSFPGGMDGSALGVA